MDCFKEHILTLLMCGEADDFNELPTPVKSAFTKLYNKLNQSSIKPVKKSKRIDEDSKNYNFDPEVQSEPSDFDYSSDSAGEPEIVALN